MRKGIIAALAVVLLLVAVAPALAEDEGFQRWFHRGPGFSVAGTVTAVDVEAGTITIAVVKSYPPVPAGSEITVQTTEDTVFQYFRGPGLPPMPTAWPTFQPPTRMPTVRPSVVPPTPWPTARPTLQPPTRMPTARPTSVPPTPLPTARPTSRPVPTPTPTVQPPTIENVEVGAKIAVCGIIQDGVYVAKHVMVEQPASDEAALP